MEQVYVLPASVFPPPQNRLIPLEAPLLQKIEREGFFIEQPRAEEDPTSPMPWCATGAAIC